MATNAAHPTGAFAPVTGSASPTSLLTWSRATSMEPVTIGFKQSVAGTVVTCSTSVGPREGGGFGIAVKMHVKVPTLPAAEAQALVQETHEKICPYSHATRGNIDFTLEVEGA